MSNKNIDIKPEDLDFGERFLNQNDTNPLYTQIFNQPAMVDGEKCEYKVLPISKLHEFPNHPFKVDIDDEMQELRDSIYENGVLQPLLVRPQQNGEYIILSGHRRKAASKMAQLSEVPCVIMKGLTDDQATIIMIDSNQQREHILPSERAFAYKMKLEAMKHQGKRTDLTSAQIEQKSSRKTSIDIFSEEIGQNRNQIQRYIRLTYLIPQLLDLVDNDVLKKSPSMAFIPAVEISYLTPEEQKYFYDTVKTLQKTPSVQQAKEIKNLSKQKQLTQTAVMSILVKEKPNQRETVKVDYNRLNKYYKENYSAKEYETKVFESLDSLTKIKLSVNKHIKGKTLSDPEIATLVDNLLSEYCKTHNRNDIQR